MAAVAAEELKSIDVQTCLKSNDILQSIGSVTSYYRSLVQNEAMNLELGLCKGQFSGHSKCRKAVICDWSVIIHNVGDL